VVLTDKYYDGIIPEPATFSEIDEQTLNELKAYPAVIASSIERYRFREAQAELMNVARLGNKYLADEEPWKTIKTDEERTKTVMYVALQIASALAILSEPFLPFTSEKLKKMLNVTLSAVEGWNDVSSKSELVKPGHKIGKAELLFSKIEDEQIEAQLEKLKQTKMDNKVEKVTDKSSDVSQNDGQTASAEIASQKATIQYDDFAKLDMRVGTIIEAEKMPKADKLLVLKVDTGIDVRTIVSGIAESFKPEEIIGKKVTVLANLAPRALRGVESQGMILMTENVEGKLVFVNPGEEGVENGATIN
jgi:methionyl-tRNA synthetase